MATQTKKQKRQEESIEQAAVMYREKMLAIKALEKEAAPYKKVLLDHAKELAVDSIEIAQVTLERRITPKGDIASEMVTPDWLYRMQRDGYSTLLKLGIDYKGVQASVSGDERLVSYLNEAGFTEKESVTYAVRI